ncbi:MAG: ABC transporter substrate-binding protein [Chloroflexi bacterium]|nr:ABC transporter substrate-binding protein [Chloroflexota bacterium]
MTFPRAWSLAVLLVVLLAVASCRGAPAPTEKTQAAPAAQAPAAPAAQAPAAPAAQATTAPAPPRAAPSPAPAITPIAALPLVIGRTALGHPIEHPSLKFAAVPPKDWKVSDIRRGGVVVTGESWVAPHFDPRVFQGSGMMNKVEPVLERLLRANRNQDYDPYKEEFVPNLAERWEIKDGGKTVVYYLRKNVRWQNVPPVNGRELTSTDVKFSYEQYMKEGLNKGLLGSLDRVETPDKYTVVFRLNEADSSFIEATGWQGMFILAKEVMDQDGDFKKTLVGTGPFVLKKHIRDEIWEVERNPNYWDTGLDGKPLPYLDGILTRIIPDVATRKAALRAERVEMIATGAWSNLDDIQEMKRTNPKLVIQQWMPSLSTYAVQWDNTKPPFTDVRVRRALTMAMNRDQLDQVIFKGAGFFMLDVAWSHAFDAPVDLRTMSPWYKYNPQEAKKLLAEAGFPNGLGSTELGYYVYGLDQFRQVEMTAQQYKEQGIINLKLVEQDYATHASYNNTGNWADKTPPGQLAPFLSEWVIGEAAPVTAFLAQYQSKSSLNNYRVQDAQIDQWLAQLKATFDPKEQKRLSKLVYERVVDQAYRNSTGGSFAFEVSQPWVKNYVKNIWRGYGQWRYHLREVWLDDRGKYK